MSDMKARNCYLEQLDMEVGRTMASAPFSPLVFHSSAVSLCTDNEVMDLLGFLVYFKEEI